MLGMISAINHTGSAVLGAMGLGRCPVVSNLWIFSVCGYSQTTRPYDDVPLSALYVRERVFVCVCCAELVTQRQNSVVTCVVG